MDAAHISMRCVRHGMRHGCDSELELGLELKRGGWPAGWLVGSVRENGWRGSAAVRTNALQLWPWQRRCRRRRCEMSKNEAQTCAWILQLATTAGSGSAFSVQRSPSGLTSWPLPERLFRPGNAAQINEAAVAWPSSANILAICNFIFCATGRTDERTNGRGNVCILDLPYWKFYLEREHMFPFSIHMNVFLFYFNFLFFWASTRLAAVMARGASVWANTLMARNEQGSCLNFG